MERVQDAEQTVEVFENEIQMYLSMFCESNAIESEYDILPSQWNAALSYIYKHVIKPNPDILTIPHTVSNSYNINAVDDLLEMYIYMCYCHNQEVHYCNEIKYPNKFDIFLICNNCLGFRIFSLVALALF